MIDFYNEIYTSIATPLQAQVPGINVTGSVSNQKPSFPCVSIEETLNTDAEIDSGEKAPCAELTYRVTVQTNKKGARIADARKILGIVDSLMQPLNFRRTAMATQDGLYNNSAYKIEATYKVGITASGVLFKLRY